MALIKCPECGKKVSDQATACIHCGYPISSVFNPEEKLTLSLNRESFNKSEFNKDIEQKHGDVEDCVIDAKKKLKSWKIVLIISVALFSLLLAVIVLCAHISQNDELTDQVNPSSTDMFFNDKGNLDNTDVTDTSYHNYEPKESFISNDYQLVRSSSYSTRPTRRPTDITIHI